MLWLIGVSTDKLTIYKAKTLPFKLSEGWKFKPRVNAYQQGNASSHDYCRNRAHQRSCQTAFKLTQFIAAVDKNAVDT